MKHTSLGVNAEVVSAGVPTCGDHATLPTPAPSLAALGRAGLLGDLSGDLGGDPGKASVEALCKIVETESSWQLQ